MNYRKKLLIMAVALGLLTSSVDSFASNSEDESRESIKSSIQVMGTIKGPLEAYMNELGSTISAETPSHIVLGSEGVQELNPEQQQLVTNSYQVGKAIILTYPTKGVVEKTCAWLKETCLFAGNPETVEIYVLYKGDKSLNQEVFSRAKEESDKSIKKSKDLFADLLKKLDSTESETLISNLAISAVSEDPKFKNILDYATYMTSTNHYTSEMGSYSFTSISVPSSLRHDDNSIEYFFYISQFWNLNPEEKYIADSYEITNFFSDSRWQNMGSIIVSSPETTEGSSTTGSTTSYTIGGGGNLGFFGDVPTGGVSVSGSYGYSSSHSFTTPGVVTKNQSIDDSNMCTVHWYFDINHHSPVAKNNFQPYLQWIWRLKKKDIEDHGFDPGTDGGATLPLTTQLWPRNRHHREIINIVGNDGQNNTGAYEWKVSLPPDPIPT